MLFGKPKGSALNFGINGKSVDEHLIQLPFLFKNVKEPGKVLDIGCTGSPAALQLAIMRYNVTGIDYIDYGQKHSNLKFIEGDFNKHDFGKERFDIVLAMNTVEHMGLQYYKKDEYLDKQADVKALTKVKEIVNKGAQLIFTAKYGIPELATLSDKPYVRIYDDKALDVLLSTFHIDSTEYYMVADRKTIRQVPKQEAQGSRYYHKSGTYGLICVSATKL